MPLPAIFQLYHGNQFQWWRKLEYSERTTDPRQATGKLIDRSTVYYYLSASEIWPYKKGWPLVGGTYKREGTLTENILVPGTVAAVYLTDCIHY